MQQTDLQLVKNVLQGQELAFEKLLKKYINSVFNFIYQLVRDEEEAEDISQETFFKVYRQLKSFDETKSFKTWLYIIAKHTTFDYLKKKKAVPFSLLDDEEEGLFIESIQDEAILPSELLERKDIEKELQHVLEKIPANYRLILIMHYKEDLSLGEIAQVLDKPYNTIKSQHQRALKSLKTNFFKMHPN